MKKTSFFVSTAIWLLTSIPTIGQQIAIPRIDKMPNKPASYKMIDWKKLTTDYDNFVFDVNKTGDELPISSINQSEGINYPEIRNIKMQTFVGHPDKSRAEAINVIPAIVGASLVGVDKTNHKGENWVVKIKDFYNKKNGENVYLNNYSANSGGDWWYDVMPNVYFYQMYSLYPNADPDFSAQMISIADRHLDVIHKLGGRLYPWTAPNMNHRAFNLLTGVPYSDGVPEPETAGSIAWLLYQAYLHTSDTKYKQGAELALEFLQSWTKNPSYELQLPYGIIAAARLNAEQGANFDIEKFMNWTFSSGHGTLRLWGAIAGNWNGYSMDGLIGEAMDGGDDYAFVMNGFQHAAALAPVAKYDKRYARALAKWMLNLASASRYFYPGQLPEEFQEATSLKWAKEHDPNSCIPYEAMKQSWKGKSPFTMGDALRSGWAKTDLSLYSGSSVGYLASLISPTNVEAILQINLNKTDFLGNNAYPNFLYYNPNPIDETVTLNLPAGNHDIYDAISETIVKSNASGAINFTIKADNVALLVIYPSGSTTKKEGNLLKVVDGDVIDFHSGYSYNTSFRMKSFSGSNEQIKINEDLIFNCLTENADGVVSYKWYIDGIEITGATESTYKWTPTEGKLYKVKAQAINKGQELSTQELEVQVFGGDYVLPKISEIKLNGESPFDLGAEVNITAITNAPNAEVKWEVDGGILKNIEGLTPIWTLPSEKGYYTLTLTIKNDLGEVSFNKKAQVKDADAADEYTPLVHYTFNGNTKNAIQDAFHATSVNAKLTSDAKDRPNSAYRFANNQQYLYTENDPSLNFGDQMTLSFWIKPEAIGSEQYVISHGSWEQRYKVSLAPEGKLVMTLNTSTGIVDMADDTKLMENGKFYHYVIVYDGSTLQMYRDGKLVNSRQVTGKINKTSKALTIGRKEVSETNNTFQGVIDEFRLYDVAVSSQYASELHDMWGEEPIGDVTLSKLVVNGIEWDIEKKFILDCEDNNQSIPVTITPADGATVDIGTETIVLINGPSLKNVPFSITSKDGASSKDYLLVIEKRFDFNSLVSQKWNNLLTVNNNYETNGGYNFVGYQWFKDGEMIGEKQYYSAGKKATDYLDPNAHYMVELTLKGGETLSTCPSSPVLTKSKAFTVYPSPADVGSPITVYTGVDASEIKEGKLFVYSLSGNLVYKQDVTKPDVTFSLKESGTYTLKLEINAKQSFSSVIIVK